MIDSYIPKVGLLILNYNDYDTTTHLYNIVKDYEAIDEIIIVDNHSTDDSFKELSKLSGKNLHIIRTERNGGYAYGNNVGAKYLIENCKCNILLIANPDVEFEESVIKKLCYILTSGKAEAATGVMINRDGSIGTRELHIHSYCQDLLDCTLLLKRLFIKKKTANLNKYNSQLVPTSFLYGSFFAILSDCYYDISGFDENTFLYCEERILGKKFESKGYKMVIDPSLKYMHYHSISINKSLDNCKQIQQLFKSRLYYWKTYGNISHFKYVLMSAVMKYGIGIRKVISSFRKFFWWIKR